MDSKIHHQAKAERSAAIRITFSCKTVTVLSPTVSHSLRRIFFSIAQQPLEGQGLFIIGFTITLRHHIQQDSPGQVMSRMQNLRLTIHNTHKRKTSMPPAGFEPTLPAS
jgi:hypothetical protein